MRSTLRPPPAPEPIVQPKIYTIAPERPFLATLANGLLAMIAGDPTRLLRITILLPTRRAVRALREAFLRAAPEGREAGAPLVAAPAVDRRSRFGRTDFGEWDSGRRSLGGATRHPRAEAPSAADAIGHEIGSAARSSPSRCARPAV
jgi:ATP-dependent helicase/nuclease subunit B